MSAVAVSVVLFCTFSFAIGQGHDKSQGNIFTLLRKYGHERKGSWNQYLVVTMLTEQEFVDSRNWNDLSYLTNHQNGNRVKFYLNKKFPGKLNESSPHKDPNIHGEVIFLYLDDNAPQKLEAMLPNQGHSKGLPYLIFFSHYIPCACVKNCNFHCSEELGHAARRYKNKYKILVAYIRPFKLTNESAAEDFMKRGGIYMYKYIKGLFRPLQYVPYIEKNYKPSDIFQNNLRDLLVQSPVAQCTPENVNDRKRIAVAFINIATRGCFEDSDRNYFGRLTKLNDNYLYECLRRYIYNAIGNDCDRLGKSLPDIRDLFIGALDNALRQSARIGYPRMEDDLDYRPVEDNVLWKKLFTKVPKNSSLRCRNPFLTFESFCTKVGEIRSLSVHNVKKVVGGNNKNVRKHSA